MALGNGFSRDRDGSLGCIIDVQVYVRAGLSEILRSKQYSAVEVHAGSPVPARLRIIEREQQSLYDCVDAFLYDYIIGYFVDGFPLLRQAVFHLFLRNFLGRLRLYDLGVGSFPFLRMDRNLQILLALQFV